MREAPWPWSRPICGMAPWAAKDGLCLRRTYFAVRESNWTLVARSGSASGWSVRRRPGEKNAQRRRRASAYDRHSERGIRDRPGDSRRRARARSGLRACLGPSDPRAHPGDTRGPRGYARGLGARLPRRTPGDLGARGASTGGVAQRARSPRARPPGSACGLTGTSADLADHGTRFLIRDPRQQVHRCLRRGVPQHRHPDRQDAGASAEAKRHRRVALVIHVECPIGA